MSEMLNNVMKFVKDYATDVISSFLRSRNTDNKVFGSGVYLVCAVIWVLLIPYTFKTLAIITIVLSLIIVISSKRWSRRNIEIGTTVLKESIEFFLGTAILVFVVYNITYLIGLLLLSLFI